MATKMIYVDFKVGSIRYRIRGAKWFYGDSDVRGKIGADIINERDQDEDFEDEKNSYQRKLVMMVARLSKDNVGRNAAQSTDSRHFRFWCRPDKVRTAQLRLKGRRIDRSLLPGSYKITKVFMPVRSNF